MKIMRIAFALILAQMISPLQAEQITVAVASNFASAMKEIVAEFERSSGHPVRLSSASSGKLFAQIKHGAPFHVFFSADKLKPQALEDAGLVVTESRFTYAVGHLVLYSTKADFLRHGVKRLKSGSYNKLALANPTLAPYGVAAMQVLSKLDLLNSTKAKWVQGENITQTYQFVSTANADLGFVALSQLVNNKNALQGSSWVVPEYLYDPIRQDAVLLKRAEHSIAARSLIEFMQGQVATKIIESFGYSSASALSDMHMHN